VREVLDSSETPVPSLETLDYEIESVTTLTQDLDELGHNKFQKVCSNVFALCKDKLQEWTGHSTLISENLKIVEISKNYFNTI
jgi:hypothetical protein